jgi:hypothetical protein
VPVARRIAGRGLSRCLPVVGAVGVAGYAFYDTMRVGETAIELFRSQFVEAGELTDEAIDGGGSTRRPLLE